MNAGITLRNLRRKKGLTQQQLAARLRISRNAYMAWEKNRVELTLGRLNAICDILEISVWDFFQPEEESPPPDAPVKQLARNYDSVCDRLSVVQEQTRELVRLNRKLGQIAGRTVKSGKIPNLQGPTALPDEIPDPPYYPVHSPVACLRTVDSV